MRNVLFKLNFNLQCARSANLKEETVAQILNCKSNDSIADVLLVAHGEKTKTLNPSLSFVPTVVINKVKNFFIFNIFNKQHKKIYSMNYYLSRNIQVTRAIILEIIL